MNFDDVISGIEDFNDGAGGRGSTLVLGGIVKDDRLVGLLN
jgi:hypothetical protein